MRFGLFEDRSSFGDGDRKKQAKKLFDLKELKDSKVIRPGVSALSERS